MLLAPSGWSRCISEYPSLGVTARNYVTRSRFRHRKTCVLVCSYGVELEEIKKWFQSKLQQDRNRLSSIEDCETPGKQLQQRVGFDLNLAVVLAGFAFEAYNTPPKDSGVHVDDGKNCETIFLNEDLLREVYQGQLTVKLERANNLPGFDLWGTSDPYVWLRVGDGAKRSRTIWASKDPVWNETINLNVVDPQTQSLQIAVWDENILSIHRRLGNTAIPLESLCDGSSHKIKMDLEGMGGGGTISVEVFYKTFAQMDAEKNWKIPLLSDLIDGAALSSILTSIFGTEGIKVLDFVGSAFAPAELPISRPTEATPALSTFEEMEKPKESTEISSDEGLLNFEIVKSLKIPQLGLNFQIYENLKQLGLDFQAQADSRYIVAGLADPVEAEGQAESKDDQSQLELIPQTTDVKNALVDMLGRTEEALGSWLMSTTPFGAQGQEEVESKELGAGPEQEILKQEKMTEMFKRAETAMEAWAILATSLGRTSFVKSEFEKICFIENDNTDTQVAVWRDVRGKRLVVAFRGTEQTKWKDLATDLMLVPTGFNPERCADGDFDKEVFVHSGFLSAYDSVRTRLMSIIKSSMKYSDEQKWHLYATGHSLGGALATLLTMDLTHSEMVKNGKVLLTMYNFGSPRVGNKAFADEYNDAVMDSWRIVNHRDIIPTVPRLMGYCHVAQPIYLQKNNRLVEDNYIGDVIGEATPVAFVGECLKGETQVIEKLLRTEVTMLRAIRDGSALMQHMEDFYYISLLECVSTKCNISDLCTALSQLVNEGIKTA